MKGIQNEETRPPWIRRGPKLTLAFVAASLTLIGCGGDGSDAPPDEGAEPVAVWTVQFEELEIGRPWVGRLEPLRTIAVQAPREGRVEGVDVRDGDRAGEGQVLVRMVGPDLEARRSAASERRSQLEAELERWEGLAAASAAGQGEVSAATLRVLQAREAMDELEALSEAYQLRSPAAGRIYGTTVTPGAQVSAGQVLMGVEDDQSWGVRLSVSVWEAPLFDSPESLVVRDEQGASLQVARVASASDIHPGFVRVDLYLEAMDGSRRGVEVTHTASDRILLIPWTAVAGDRDQHWVARVDPGDPPRVERRTVELGRTHPRGVEVVSGLEEGDQIVRYEPRSHPENRAVAPVGASQ